LAKLLDFFLLPVICPKLIVISLIEKHGSINEHINKQLDREAKRKLTILFVRMLIVFSLCFLFFSPLRKLALISFFFLFSSSSFLMISPRQIISGFAGPIFVVFSPNESVLGTDDRSTPFFPMSQGKLPWQPIL